PPRFRPPRARPARARGRSPRTGRRRRPRGAHGAAAAGQDPCAGSARSIRAARPAAPAGAPARARASVVHPTQHNTVRAPERAPTILGRVPDASDSIDSGRRNSSRVIYRERLWIPWWWWLVGAAIAALV